MSVTKAFMSYSWDDDQHKEWVAKLATNLREDGIETILDFSGMLCQEISYQSLWKDISVRTTMY